MSQNKKIHILILITMMDRGGAETVMMNYFRAMDRDKFQVDFLINRPDKSDYEDEIESLGGKVYHMSPLYPWTIHRYKKEFKQFLQDHPEYDVIHSHLAERSAEAFKIAKKMGVPFRIVHAHSIPGRGDTKLLLRKILRIELKGRYTDKLSCAEKPARWLYRNMADVGYMKNSIDTDFFKADEGVREATRKELGVDEDTLLIGHIGRFTYEKNHMFLIDIFNEILKRKPNSKLILIGGGKPKVEQKNIEKTKNKIKKIGIEDKVEFLGVQENANKYLQAMDIFLMPSVSEGFPLTVVEAQALGTRCVVSDRIPNECNLTGTVIYKSLSDSASDWADEIIEISKQPVDKIVSNQMIKDKGYDVKESVFWLEDLYSRPIPRGEDRMKSIKAWYHLKAGVKRRTYKLIYKNQLTIGKGTTWRDGFHIAIEGGRIIIGKDCFFNNNCSINSLHKITIGNGTIFGANCHIYDHNHKFNDFETSIKDQGYTVGETKIGSHCWFGTNVVVLKGVTIGDNCVIGAGVVVKEDVPAGTVLR